MGFCPHHDERSKGDIKLYQPQGFPARSRHTGWPGDCHFMSGRHCTSQAGAVGRGFRRTSRVYGHSQPRAYRKASPDHTS